MPPPPEFTLRESAELFGVFPRLKLFLLPALELLPLEEVEPYPGSYRLLEDVMNCRCKIQMAITE